MYTSVICYYGFPRLWVYVLHNHIYQTEITLNVLVPVNHFVRATHKTRTVYYTLHIFLLWLCITIHIHATKLHCMRVHTILRYL